MTFLIIIVVIIINVILMKNLQNRHTTHGTDRCPLYVCILSCLQYDTYDITIQYDNTILYHYTLSYGSMCTSRMRSEVEVELLPQTPTPRSFLQHSLKRYGSIMMPSTCRVLLSQTRRSRSTFPLCLPPVPCLLAHPSRHDWNLRNEVDILQKCKHKWKDVLQVSNTVCSLVQGVDGHTSLHGTRILNRSSP